MRSGERRNRWPPFVSLAPDPVGAEQARDLRAALARAARAQSLGERLDWQRTVWPGRRRLAGETKHYDRTGAAGVA